MWDEEPFRASWSATTSSDEVSGLIGALDRVSAPARSTGTVFMGFYLAGKVMLETESYGTIPNMHTVRFIYQSNH